MMKNWIKIVSILMIIPANLVGQSVSPSLISSSGLQLETDQIHLQWSLGEVAIRQTIDPSLQLSEGFHQDLFVVSSTFTNGLQPKLPYLMYPNPTTAFIHIEMKRFGRITYELQDILGNLLMHGSFVENTKINTTSMPQGIYFLKLSQRHKQLGSSKIIKL